MSYDFAVLLPECVPARGDAGRVHAAMCEAELGPAPQLITDLVAVLNTRHGVEMDDDPDTERFLMVDCAADARGTVVCSRWDTVPDTTWTLLHMTRQCGLLLYDPQIDRLYDPRGHVEVQVELGGEVQVPYLSPSLLAEYFERPERDAPWLIVEREDHVYIQAYLKPGGAVEVEHRRGGPDQHYAVTTDDPELARSIIWMWASGDPAWESALRWQHVTV